MTLTACCHGVLLGSGCYRCDQMARAIRAEACDEAPPDPTPQERTLRRESRWPAWLERSLAARGER